MDDTTCSLFRIELYLINGNKYLQVEGGLIDSNNSFFQLIQLTPDWKSWARFEVLSMLLNITSVQPVSIQHLLCQGWPAHKTGITCISLENHLQSQKAVWRKIYNALSVALMLWIKAFESPEREAGRNQCSVWDQTSGALDGSSAMIPLVSPWKSYLTSLIFYVLIQNMRLVIPIFWDG